MAEKVARKKWEKVPEFNFKDIIYEKRPGVAKITINRPEAYNAFTTYTQIELVKALQDAADDAAIGVVVLTGAGDKAFCTGGDAKEAKSGFKIFPSTVRPSMGLGRSSTITGILALAQACRHNAMV